MRIKRKCGICPRVGIEVLLALTALMPPATMAVQANSPEDKTAMVHGLVSRLDVQGATTPLEGIPVRLRAASPNSPEETTYSGADGTYQFGSLKSGRYLLKVDLEGFTPHSTDFSVDPGESKSLNIGLELANVATSVEVVGGTSEIMAQTAQPNGTLKEEEFPALPMAQQNLAEALPIIPGVVRSMDGAMSIKGEAANQGMLLVDSAQMVDPVTGTFSVSVPLASVQTLNVFETPLSAEYGGFSGGLVTVETKSPPDQWKYAMLDFVPGLRMKSGHISGVSAETPRLFVGGPLIKNRLTFSEAFDYTIKNRPVRGQPWPVNENLLRGFTSYTSLQAILSPRHMLKASVAAFSNREQFADINALLPRAASSNVGSKGSFATLTSISQFSAGTLSTTFRYTRFESNVYGQGDRDLIMTPEGFSGNAFNRWKRTANRFQVLPSMELTQKRWFGSHDLKFGTDIVHQYFDGTSHSSSIHVLREDGSPAERIDFTGSGIVNAAQTEASNYVQDHWTLTSRVALDAGLRVTTQSDGRTAALAPRAGIAYSLPFEKRTVLRAGGGYFYDRVPALASAFPQNLTRVQTLYDNTGVPLTGPTVYRNAYWDPNSPSQPIRLGGSPGSSPRNLTWKVEGEHALTSAAVLHVSYLQSQTSDLYYVAPFTGSAQIGPILGLSHSGNSRYREFQTGLRYQLGRRGDFSIAYLRTEAKGSLNTLAGTYTPFEQPIIRRNVNDYLPYDIPNRLLGSGVFQLPFGLTVSPVIDYHTGFRYSDVDELNQYVGRPNSQRFPRYFSLDLKVYRDFRIPARIGFLKNYRFRIGVYELDATNHLNPHDVFNNVTSPVFGHFVGFQHRVTGMLIDLFR